MKPFSIRNWNQVGFELALRNLISQQSSEDVVVHPLGRVQLLSIDGIEPRQELAFFLQSSLGVGNRYSGQPVIETRVAHPCCQERILL